jgi:hypothetical protein
MTVFSFDNLFNEPIYSTPDNWGDICFGTRQQIQCRIDWLSKNNPPPAYVNSASGDRCESSDANAVPFDPWQDVSTWLPMGNRSWYMVEFYPSETDNGFRFALLVVRLVDDPIPNDELLPIAEPDIRETEMIDFKPICVAVP